MAQVSVGTTATLIGTYQGAALVVWNRGTTSVFLDFNSGVKTSTGLELGSGQSLTLPRATNMQASLYAVCASGTNRVDSLVVPA